MPLRKSRLGCCPIMYSAIRLSQKPSTAHKYGYKVFTLIKSTSKSTPPCKSSLDRSNPPLQNDRYWTTRGHPHRRNLLTRERTERDCYRCVITSIPILVKVWGLAHKLISEKFDAKAKWNDERKIGCRYKLNLNESKRWRRRPTIYWISEVRKSHRANRSTLSRLLSALKYRYGSYIFSSDGEICVRFFWTALAYCSYVNVSEQNRRQRVERPLSRDECVDAEIDSVLASCVPVDSG